MNDYQKIIHHDDGTVTVVNQRIRVTVPRADFDQYGRAVILSDAMRALGNASELQLLKSEPIDPVEVKRTARDNLIYEYLSQHCHYDINDTLMRYYGDHRMSAGMAADVAEAIAYADGVLSPIDNDETMRLISTAFAGKQRGTKHRRALKNITLKRGNGTSDIARQAIAEATRIVEENLAREISYRQRVAGLGDCWKIEIIGEMPEQIGLCRYSGG